MASLSRIASIEDLRARAKRRLPAFAYTYIDEGAGDDTGVARNQAAFAATHFRVQRLRPPPTSTAVEIFGRTFSQPFGIAPVGLANIAWPGADAVLAALAEREQIPYVLSTAATTTIEAIIRLAPSVTWFQLYPSREEAVTDDLIRRAWDAGIRVLVLTVDVPASPRRNRSIRGAVSIPFRFTPRVIADLMFHPRWALATLLNGAGPKLANYAPYIKSANVNYAGRLIGRLNKHGLQWSDVHAIREKWKGKLVIKGLLESADAVAAAKAGADAVWMSNHGGRQHESIPPVLGGLPATRTAVVPEIPVFADSGVRSGGDVVKACALGAQMVFCGRAFVYAAAAAGRAGATKAMEIMSAEVVGTLAQIGCGSVQELGPDFILMDSGIRGGR